MAKDIGEEYLDLKLQLATVQRALNAYSKSVDESGAAWTALLKTQREFAAAMTASYARDDTVRATAQQFASNLTALQGTYSLGAGADAPHRQLHTTVGKYLHEIEEANKQFVIVEHAYAEFLRYATKADRIANRKNRSEEKLARNMEKRERARVEFHAKLDATVATMRAVLRKHPAVFQIALASYWLRNSHTLSLFSDHTGQMHSECAAIADALIRVDLTQPHTYENLLPANADPIPMPPPPSVPQHFLPAPTNYPALPAPPPAPPAIMPAPAPAPPVAYSAPVPAPTPAASFPHPPAPVSARPTSVAIPKPPPAPPAPVQAQKPKSSFPPPPPPAQRPGSTYSAPPPAPPPPPMQPGRPMRPNMALNPPPPPPPPPPAPAIHPPPIVHGSSVTSNKSSRPVLA